MAAELNKMEKMEENSRSPSESKSEGLESSPCCPLGPRQKGRESNQGVGLSLIDSSGPEIAGASLMLLVGCRAPAALLLPNGARLISSSPGPLQVTTASPLPFRSFTAWASFTELWLQEDTLSPQPSLNTPLNRSRASKHQLLTNSCNHNTLSAASRLVASRGRKDPGRLRATHARQGPLPRRYKESSGWVKRPYTTLSHLYTLNHKEEPAIPPKPQTQRRFPAHA